jgi:adenylate kinase
LPVGANHVIIIGPQGAGKGTQAAAVAPRLGLVHVATGDLFRQLLQADTDLSREVRSYYDRGALVPDELTIRVLYSRINELQRENPSMRGVLLDGFPRNQTQAEALDAALEDRGDRVAAVALISVPRPALMERLTGRLICSNCGATYHTTFNPPKVEGVCDVCGGELYQRSDDTPAAVEKRLSIYYEQTEPILEHYRAAGVLVEVDGAQPIDRVTADLLAALEPKLGPS